MTFEWNSQAALTASSSLKAMAGDTSCETAICNGSVVSVTVEKAEDYSQETSDMVACYAEALYTDGANIEKKTVYFNIMDDKIGTSLTMSC